MRPDDDDCPAPQYICDDMGELLKETLSNHLGVQLLQWAFSQSEVGSVANRCLQFVSKIHEPLERGALVLDSILTVEEEESGSGDWQVCRPASSNRSAAYNSWQNHRAMGVPRARGDGK